MRDFIDKGFVKFGDFFINFVFFFVLSEYFGKFMGEWVLNVFFVIVFEMVGFRYIIFFRMDKYGKGDIVEVFFVYVWLEKKIIIEEVVEIFS